MPHTTESSTLAAGRFGVEDAAGGHGVHHARHVHGTEVLVHLYLHEHGGVRGHRIGHLLGYVGPGVGFGLHFLLAAGLQHIADDHRLGDVVVAPNLVVHELHVRKGSTYQGRIVQLLGQFEDFFA